MTVTRSTPYSGIYPIAPTPFTKVYDLNGAFGGPIKKDRIWYFVNARTQGSTKIIANIFYNQNSGDPAKWTYADFNDPRLNQWDGGLAPTAAYPRCVSPAGLYDCVGNLHTKSCSSTFTNEGGGSGPIVLTKH